MQCAIFRLAARLESSMLRSPAGIAHSETSIKFLHASEVQVQVHAFLRQFKVYSTRFDKFVRQLKEQSDLYEHVKDFSKSKRASHAKAMQGNVRKLQVSALVFRMCKYENQNKYSDN